MLDLDSEKNLKKIDKKDVLGSIRKFADQIEQSWNEVHSIKLPNSCSEAENIVITGMGGSALGGRILDSLLESKIRVPMEIFNGYHLPHYVNQKSLVIVSSYSGGTEETVSCLEEALHKKAQIFGIATGGKLAEILEDNKIPSYIFEPKANPSGQPRLALGYSVAAILALLSKCSFVTMHETEINDAIKLVRDFTIEFDVDRKSHENLAKSTARKLKNKIPILIASEHLVGASHAFGNQINETAKNFSVYFGIPELNHHLMEGLRNPAAAKEFLYFFLFESKLYSERVQKRYLVTKDVLAKNEVQSGGYILRSDTKLDQVFELLTFGSFIQFYLAMLYEIDPSPVPWVDYFKSELAKK